MISGFIRSLLVGPSESQSSQNVNRRPVGRPATTARGWAVQRQNVVNDDYSGADDSIIPPDLISPNHIERTNTTNGDEYTNH